MELSKEQVDLKRKRWIAAASIVLFGLLLFFTLFSNTLQSVALPKVRTGTATSGGLAYTLEGSGVLQPIKQTELSNPAGWQVRQVLVKEGEAVKAGQKLVVYDSSSAERELEDEIAQLDKMNIALEAAQDQYIASTVGGDELDSREAKRELAARQIDLSVQRRKIEGLRERLNRQRELTAPFDGIVLEMNAVEGLASAGQPDAVISSRDFGYQLDLVADGELVDRLELAAGQPIELRIAAAGKQPERSLKGIIDEMTDDDSRRAGSPEGDGGETSSAVRQKRLRIHVADSSLRGGEQVSVRLKRPSSEKGWIVPNEAVHREGESKFIFTVDQQRGALGNVFVARKVPIEASASNGRETMIPPDRLYEGDLIILESSEPLQDGNRVRLQ